MTILNSLLGPLVDLVQAPLRGLPPVVGVILWSIPVSIFALWIFGERKQCLHDLLADTIVIETTSAATPHQSNPWAR